MPESGALALTEGKLGQGGTPGEAADELLLCALQTPLPAGNGEINSLYLMWMETPLVAACPSAAGGGATYGLHMLLDMLCSDTACDGLKQDAM